MRDQRRARSRCKHMRGKITETLADRVKTRLRSQHREPGSPDVGWNQKCVLWRFPTPIRADPEHRDLRSGGRRSGYCRSFQACDEIPGCLQIRNKNQIVILSSPTGFFIDVADLSCQKQNEQSPGRRAAHVHPMLSRHPLLVAKVRVRRIKLAFDLGEPGRMAEVPGTDQLNPLDLGGLHRDFPDQDPSPWPGNIWNGHAGL